MFVKPEFSALSEHICGLCWLGFSHHQDRVTHALPRVPLFSNIHLAILLILRVLQPPGLGNLSLRMTEAEGWGKVQAVLWGFPHRPCASK